MFNSSLIFLYIWFTFYFGRKEGNLRRVDKRVNIPNRALVILGP